MSDGEPDAVRTDFPVRRIRSFVRREGRITSGQQDALQRLLPRWSLEAEGVAAGVVDFNTVFGRTAPVSLEIGFGNGDALLTRAQAAPQHNHLGAEVHRPGVGRLLLHLEKLGLENVRVTSQDAVELLRERVADASLAEVVIEFPDPWHKTRHHKRRLIQPAFAQLLARKLAPGGCLRLATDWAPYAQQMVDVLNAEPGLRNAAADQGFVPRPPARARTRFEARGERLGHAVFDLEYWRRDG